MIDALDPKGRVPEIEDLGGLVLVCRKGWALRLDDKSEETCFAVFIVGGCVVVDVGSWENEEQSATRTRKGCRSARIRVVACELHWILM